MSTRDDDGFFDGTDDPMARVEAERARLDEIGRVWDEESTTVKAKDNAFSMTFDGRGELTGVTFHGGRYKTLAPTELAHRLVETLGRGKAESLEKVIAQMSPDGIAGVDMRDLVRGKVSPREFTDKLMAPLRANLDADLDEFRKGTNRG